MSKKTRLRAEMYPRKTLVLPITLFDQRPTPPSVLLHRENIALAAQKKGPMYTAPKGARA